MDIHIFIRCSPRQPRAVLENDVKKKGRKRERERNCIRVFLDGAFCTRFAIEEERIEEEARGKLVVEVFRLVDN